MNYIRSKRKRSYLEINDFLKSAITDLTGNLTLLDTKVSIVIATVGVILGLVVACKSNILKAYYFYTTNRWLMLLFVSLSISYIISIVMSFVFGVKCIFVRFGNSQSKSLWFFKTEKYGGISEKNYIYKVKKMTTKELTNNLAVEVYKLNMINNCKMHNARITMIMFSISCSIISGLMTMVGFCYLVV